MRPFAPTDSTHHTSPPARVPTHRCTAHECDVASTPVHTTRTALPPPRRAPSARLALTANSHRAAPLRTALCSARTFVSHSRLAMAPLWQTDVQAALQQAVHPHKLFLLLQHPSAQTLSPPSAPEAEHPHRLLSRVATSALHRLLFANPAVLTALQERHVVCVLARANALQPCLRDMLDTLALPAGVFAAPVLTVCSLSERRVLLHRSGYVSPNQMLSVLSATAPEAPSNSVLPKPTPPSTASTSAPVKRDLPAASLSLQSSSAPVKDANLRFRLPSGELFALQKPPSTPFRDVRTAVANRIQTPANYLLFTHAAPPHALITVADDMSPLSSLSLSPSATLLVSVREQQQEQQQQQQQQTASHVSSMLRTRLSSAASIATAFVSSFFTQPVQQNDSNPVHNTPSASSRQPQRPNQSGIGDVRDNGNSTQFAYRPHDDDPRSSP